MEIKDFVSIEERILKLVRRAAKTEWENNHWVILGEPTKKEYPDTVVYRKVLEKEYYYVECTRTGRKRLAMKTFYKVRTAPNDAVP